MLKRKALDQLRAWKSAKQNKSLIVSGARQVGKTYIVREFGREYESFVELNFLENPGLNDIFQGSLDVDTILMGIRLHFPGFDICEGSTLIFLDEIQDCPMAITALKFLAQDQRIDIIASGSALGMAYNRVTSYPVGYVDYLDMTGLDFEEFLWSVAFAPDLLAVARKHFEERTEVEPVLHEQLMRLLREYLVIGGMPEVVNAYCNGRDFQQADDIQRRIYRDYLADIARYALPADKLKAEQCYRSIPAQLMKDNHKFQYSIVEKKGTARKFGSSLEWLESARMVIPVRNVSFVEYPLMVHEISDNIRLYPSDTGLLICTFDYSLKQAVLAEDANPGIILKTAKGGLYEALIADMLSKAGHQKLHFYRREDGSAEIEFLIEGPEGVVPVEVKAGKNRARTLDNLLKKEDIAYGIKLANQNVGTDGKRITLPLYMAMWL